MKNRSPRLPYFDRLLDQLRQGDSTALTVFERNVHYGYWADPGRADGTLGDYARAAEEMTRVMLDAAQLECGMRVLDVGCGLGGTLAAIGARLEATHLVGLNIDPRQLARAQASIQVRPGNRLGFVGGDAVALPFADEQFDALLAVECAFHFPSRARFLAEAARVLHPGGRLTVSDFVLSAPMAAGWRMAAGALDLALAPMLGHYDMSYTLATYQRAARDAGFVLAEARDITAGMLPSIPMWRRLMSHLMPDYPGLGALFAIFAWLHRAGLVRYMVLSFERPLAPPRPPLAFYEPPAARAIPT
jgi:ubiquinone/menaquinone biosynthesis C-methylase UbiE